MLPPVFVELLFGLARERALWTRIGSLPSVVHLMLLQLPFGAEDLLTDSALLRVLRIVDLEVEAKSAQLLETFLALRALEDAIHSRVNLENVKKTTRFLLNVLLHSERHFL